MTQNVEKLSAADIYVLDLLVFYKHLIENLIFHGLKHDAVVFSLHCTTSELMRRLEVRGIV